MARWIGVLAALVWASAFPACGGVVGVGDIGGDDDDVADDDAADDDDTADDDDDDDDDVVDDDDDTAGDDDDDDEQPEPYWIYYNFGMDLDGGEPNAEGYLYITLTAYGGNAHQLGNELCSQSLAFWAEAVVGPGLPDDRFWERVDVAIEWGGQAYEIDNTCWWGYEDLFGGPWDLALQWEDPSGPAFNPLGFVSCASIAADAALGDTAVGPDPYGFTAAETFGEYCGEFSDYLAGNYNLGPVEGLWLGPMGYGALGSDYGYFEAQAGGWYLGLMGWMVNDPTNPAEAGLQGVYYTITPWLHGI